jgi:DNA replication protein DnaC
VTDPLSLPGWVALTEIFRSKRRIRLATKMAGQGPREYRRHVQYAIVADRSLIAHLGTGIFLTKGKNVVLLGPPKTGKTHLAISLGIKSAQTGHRVLFDIAAGWVNRLQEARSSGKLDAEHKHLRR